MHESLFDHQEAGRFNQLAALRPPVGFPQTLAPFRVPAELQSRLQDLAQQVVVTHVSHDLDIGTMAAARFASPWREQPDWRSGMFAQDESSAERFDRVIAAPASGTEPSFSEMADEYKAYAELLEQQFQNADLESFERLHVREKRTLYEVDERPSRVMPDTEKPANFKTAVGVLNQVRQAAMDMGYEVPSPKVMENARRVLARVCDKDSREFYVYPMPYGGISIDAATPPRTRVIIICGPDGTAQGLVGREMEVESKDYADVGDAPDSFILDALADLPV